VQFVFPLQSHDSRVSQLLKAYDVHKHALVALEDCVNVTESDFPHLYRNTQPGLSALSKQNIRMCLKKSERNILIFLVRLHYAVAVCNAFRLASARKDLPLFKFDFDTFPELKSVLVELEFDRERAVKSNYRKKTTRINKRESDTVDPDENDLVERLDELEALLTTQIRNSFQDVVRAVARTSMHCESDVLNY
jgi:hypothetical protein